MTLVAKVGLNASCLVVDFAIAQRLVVEPCVPAISWYSSRIPLFGN